MENSNINIKIYDPKIAENMQHSFWYWWFSANEIMELSLNDRYIKIIVLGEIRLELVEGEGFLEGYKALEQAHSLGYKDKEISEICAINDCYMNWFQFIYKKGIIAEFVDLEDADVYSFYDEAKEIAEELLFDNKFWNHPFWDNLLIKEIEAE